jgi:hypothetical protein
MSSATHHPSIQLMTTGWSAFETINAAKKIKELVLGSAASPTCYSGPSGKAQLAVQTEFIVTEYANNPSAFASLDARLDALFAEGLAVHLLLSVHQAKDLLANWQGVDWGQAVASWPNSSAFVPMQPCAAEVVNGVKCPYDVLFDEFHTPVIQHLVQTGRAQKLAVIYVLNEFGYDPNVKKDTSANWGGAANWKLKRAEALAYTAARALSNARAAANGTVPVGLKFASVTSSHTGWAPDAVYNTDQLAYILNDIMGPNGDVLGYDVYFHPADPYDSGNKNRLSPFLPMFAGGRFEISEFGRICQGLPGQFLNGTTRTTAGDITGAASYWAQAKGLNLFVFAADPLDDDAGCYSLTDPTDMNTVYSGAASEAAGLWDLIKNVTGSQNPSPCSDACSGAAVVSPNGGSYNGTTSGSSSLGGTCGGGSAPENVYSWTPSSSGLATISTCGSSYDTLLYVRSGSCSAGPEVACDDDACTPGSTLMVNVTAGTTYYIVVDGYSSSAGSYTLNVTPPGAGGGSGTCGSPILVPASGGTFNSTTSGNSGQSGSCGGGSAPEKVYSWTPSASGSATLSTCGSSLDTLLYMRSGSCNGGAQLGCNDDFCAQGSQLTANVVAGNTYYVFVDGYSSAGSFTMTITPPASCSTSSSPPLSQYTPNFAANLNCNCSAANPTCHALYKGAVNSISADKWHADLSFQKVDNTPIAAGRKYWVVVGPANPSCVDLSAYVVRASGTVPASTNILQLNNVPIWPDQASYNNDAAGSSKSIFLITDGAGTVDQKVWFQKNAIVFTKTCP